MPWMLLCWPTTISLHSDSSSGQSGGSMVMDRPPRRIYFLMDDKSLGELAGCNLTGGWPFFLETYFHLPFSNVIRNDTRFNLDENVR